MPNCNEITKDQWLKECFPEWGRWMVDEIEDTHPNPGSFSMWWMGCTGIWLKSEGDCNISIDMYSARSHTTKRSHGPERSGPNYQLGRIAGSNQPNLNPRNIPHVIDPFEVKEIDAFCTTHDHWDHMDPYSSAAILKLPDVPFIGPRYSANRWREWGVPEKRIREVKPGDIIKVKDTEIIAVDAFDRTALITPPPLGSIKGHFPDDMDERAVNYIIKTPGGSLYHAGDSHFSNYYLRHGKMHKIDVAIGAFAENMKGITDKMTSADILRMADNLGCKVIIPVHYDVWPPFYADPEEVQLLYDFKKDRYQYKFKVFIWGVGGKYTYPDDIDKIKYMYPQGFTDAMENEPNIPYKSFL
jgi:L-ascorbate 6-phosphate lactonase